MLSAFSQDKPKAYIQVQKMTNLIKNLDLEEFDNQIFYDAFNVVSHPESLKQRKKELLKMIDLQNRKTKRVWNTLKRPSSKHSSNTR